MAEYTNYQVGGLGPVVRKDILPDVINMSTKTAGQTISDREKIERLINSSTIQPISQQEGTPEITDTAETATTAATAEATDRLQKTMEELEFYPSTSEEMADLARATFTSSELANMSIDQLYQLGLNAPGTEDLRGQVDQARANLLATPPPTNSGLRVFQDVLNAKNNITNQALGESSGYQMAGLSGYAVLQQSLAERNREMTRNYNTFANSVQDMSGAMLDTYNLALSRYNVLKGELDKEDARYQQLMDEAIAHERALQVMNEQNRLNKDYYKFTQSYKGGFGYGTVDYTTPEISSEIESILSLPGGKYGAGVQCGEAVNLWTDGPRMGNSWASKARYIEFWDNPSPGDLMMTPLTEGGELIHGHVAMTLTYDPSSKNVTVAEYNRHGGGEFSINTYNVDQLNKTYGSNWGFAKATIKPQFADALNYGQMDSSVALLEDYTDRYQKLVTSLVSSGKDLISAQLQAQSEIEQQITNEFPDTEQARGVKAAFNNYINEEVVQNGTFGENAIRATRGDVTTQQVVENRSAPTAIEGLVSELYKSTKIDVEDVTEEDIKSIINANALQKFEVQLSADDIEQIYQSVLEYIQGNPVYAEEFDALFAEPSWWDKMWGAGDETKQAGKYAGGRYVSNEDVVNQYRTQ